MDARIDVVLDLVVAERIAVSGVEREAEEPIRIRDIRFEQVASRPVDEDAERCVAVRGVASERIGCGRLDDEADPAAPF